MTMLSFNYKFEQTPSSNSCSAVSLPALGAAVLMTGVLLASIPNESVASNRIDRYDTAKLNGTFSQLQNPFTGEYTKKRDFDFEASIAAFYSTMLVQQEPLGVEFEKILYDNLWELYD